MPSLNIFTGGINVDLLNREDYLTTSLVRTNELERHPMLGDGLVGRVAAKGAAPAPRAAHVAQLREVESLTQTFSGYAK
jgi:hypothetical protein